MSPSSRDPSHSRRPGSPAGHRPAVAPVVALVGGVALGTRLDVLPVALAVLLAAGGLALGRRPGWLVTAFGVGLAAAATGAGPPAAGSVERGRPVELVGRVAAHWQWNGETWSAPLRVLRLVQGRRVVPGRGHTVRVTLGGREAPPPFGSRLRLRGHLRRSPGFANALPTEPGSWRLWLKSRRLLEVEAPPGAVAALAAHLRERVEVAQAEAVAEAVRKARSGKSDAPPDRSQAPSPPLDPDELSPGPALLRALVLGDASAVEERWRRGLRRSGLSHVLAVSGLHVGLVGAVALLVAVPLTGAGSAGRLLRLGAALLAVGLYLLVAGPRPALLRATLMAALATLSLLARRPPLAGNALAVAVGGLVLHRPSLVGDLGFQLTVAATAGLVYLLPAAVRPLRWWLDRRADLAPKRPLRRLPPYAASALAPALGASLCAQLASAPFALPAFHLVSLTSPLSNLVAVPWTAVTLAAGIAWSTLALAAPGAAGRLLPVLDVLAAPFGWPSLGGPEHWGALAVVGPRSACWLLVAGVAGGLGWRAGRGRSGRRRRGRRRSGGSGPEEAGPGRLGDRRPPVAKGRPGERSAAARRAVGAGADHRAVCLVARGAAIAVAARLAVLLAAVLLAALLLASLGSVLRWGWTGRPPGASPDGRPRVSLTVLDVGQGDAVLLRDGDRAVLVDGGGWRRGDLGGRVLLPALLGEGVDRLDAMVLTHGDRDHCGGLVDLASYLRVAEVWTAPGWPASPCGSELVAAVTRGDPRRLRLLAAGDERRVGRWRFTALHPQAPQGSPARRFRALHRAVAGSAGNDHSLVLRAQALGRKVLLTGDVERRGEGAMLRRHRSGAAEVANPDLAADFLKVGHHGSRTSSGIGFLRAVRPRLAVASLGRRNPYHHPAPEVVERFRGLGVPLLRTDLHGAVRLSWSGPSGWHLRLGRGVPPP